MKAELACYQFDGVEVKPGTVEVRRNGKTLDLEPKAFRVLVHLIENRDRAVGKEELIGAIWEGVAVTDNALTRVIAQLRKELGDDARQPRYIQTLPTMGYRFVAELTVAAQPPQSPSSRPAYLLGAATLLLVGVLGAWLWTRPSPSFRVQSPPVQLTTSPGLDVCGSFSPDGKAFVYSSNRSGWFEIYVRPIDSAGAERQLTEDTLQSVDPAWSPDGKWIAFHSAARHGIWILPATGGEPRQVTEFGSNPVWSPDGKLIAFRSAEPFSFAAFDLPGLGDSTIWTVAPDGTGIRRVTQINNPPGQHAAQSWSRDGRHILFSVIWRQLGLWKVDVASGAVSSVPTDSPKLRLNPLAAPDGIGVYCAGPSPEGSAIYYQPKPGVPHIELYSTRAGVPLRMALSPDGRSLAFMQVWSVSQLWITTGDRGSGRAMFTDAVQRVKLPVYSLDGKKVAFIVQRSGSSQDLWTMNADGTGAAAVAAGPGTEEAPHWTASGDLCYNYIDQGKTQLRKIPAGQTTQEVVVEDITRLTRPKLTPDGQEIFYESGQPNNLWIKPVKGGPSRQLTFDREGITFPVISPDGRWLAAELNRGAGSQVVVVSRDGGSAQVLTDGPGQHWPGSWSSDSRRIAISHFRDGVWNIGWVDRVTKESGQVTHETAFGSFMRNPAWRPNSEEIVYERSQSTGNIHLLDLSKR